MSETIKLTVTSMTCKHCVAAVEKALQAVQGVDTVVEVDLENGTATVTGDAPAEALISAVRDAGYSAAVA